MSELKCCPFCGGEATLKRDQKDDFVEWSVGCYNRGCVCSAHTYCYDNKDDAIRDWNTRTPMSNIVEKLEVYAKSPICKIHKAGCPYRDNDNIACENCGALGALDIVRKSGVE